MIDHERYLVALHAMQTGVALEMQRGSNATDPKHLRVGINSAMVENGVLVTLLVEKGVLIWDEWYCALADAMEREVATYEERLGCHLV